MDKQEFVKMVCDNAKTKQWISCTVPVTRNDGQTFSVGVKAFWKWVQRLECVGLCDGQPEQKTIKAMSAGLSDLLDSMIERA